MPEATISAAAHPASFRDRDGRVFEAEGEIIRVLSASGAEEFRRLKESGALESLVQSGALIESTEANSREFSFDHGIPDPALVLRHPRIPFISYPYEWPFRALQCAAVHHLELHLAALERGITLTDATAYNIQFRGARPVFIDVSSLRRYREGELWLGHRQFCEQFLNPLLLEAVVGVPFQSWYRGCLEGIPADQLVRVLPLRSKIDWRVLAHVVMQSRLQSAASQKEPHELAAAARRRFPRAGFVSMLKQLLKWIRGLNPAGLKTSTWSDYEASRTYDEPALRAKMQLVSEFVTATKPRLMWDFGCNAGEYSLAALRSGAEYVVGFDFDRGALDEAFRRSRQHRAAFLPLLLDAANPSPRQGWRQSEREGILERGPCDALLALAFEHHLTIARNVPIPSFLDWLTGLGRCGVVEFVEKQDPTVQRMLALREDIFDDYTLVNFEQALGARARIVRRTQLPVRTRHLFWYER